MPKIFKYIKHQLLKFTLRFKRKARFVKWNKFKLPGLILLGLSILLGLFFWVRQLPPRAPSFKKSEIGNYSFEAKNKVFQAKFGIREQQSLVSFNVDGNKSITLSYQGNENSQPTIDSEGKNLTFKGVEPNMDIQYQTLANGIKEEIVLHQARQKENNANIFLFDGNFQNAHPKEIIKGISGSSFYDEQNNYLFHFEKPFAIDAAGNRTDNVAIQIENKNDSKVPEIKNGIDGETAYVIRLTVDEAWLNDPARTYPIIIDPTIVHDTTAEFAIGQMNRVKDTGLSSSVVTQATGGTVSYSGEYTIHTFTSGTTTFTPNVSMNVEVLVVGGGGGGGSGYTSQNNGGGGGGGGVIYNSSFSVTASPVTVTVGGGGAANTAGGNSVFGSLTAIGGGKGGGLIPSVAGGSGGSGGGGAPAGPTAGGAGTAGQGYNGAAGNPSSPYQGGGGGGAGETGNTDGLGYGGDGVAYSISGVSTYYGGGGGGGADSSAGVGGDGGGGNGVLYTSSTGGGAGTPNTGGGGGGGASQGSSIPGGLGGSGIVIIRYPTVYSTPTQSLQSYYQELGADVNTVGLWHMNETSGTSVADSSGNGNTGTATGTTIVDGILEKTRYFNGSSYVSVPDSNSLDLTDNFTISAWVNRQDTDGGTIVSKTVAGTTGGYAVLWGGSGEVYCRTNNGITYTDSYTAQGVLTSTTGWTHITAVKNGTSCRIYVNGIDRTSTNNSHANPAANALPLLIGTRTDLGSEFTIGLIDEIRISNIARTPEEIKLDASRRPYSIFTSNAIDLTDVTSWNSLSWTGAGLATGDGETPASSTGLVAQWNFNETSGTTAVSGGSCGTSCNGTLTNFTSTASQDQAAGTGWTSANRRWGAGALMFDGVDDYVSSSYMPTAYNFNGPFTIETWINTGVIANQDIVSNWRNASIGGVSNHGLFLELTSTNALRLDYRNNGTDVFNLTQIEPIQTGQWNHIVATYNPSLPSDNVKMYVNGKQLSVTANATSTFAITGRPLILGSIDGGADSINRFFSGIIDSTRIYSRALTASEVLSNYNSSRVELQTRVGASSNPNDGTWEAWKPITAETLIASMDSDVNNWRVNPSSSFPRSCKEILDNGQSTGDGVYTIYPLGATLSVYCDMTTDGGGWTLVLNNGSSSVTPPKPTWTQVINSNNVTGTFGTNLTIFDQFLGVKYWNALGPQMRLTQGATPTSISHKAIYTFNLNPSNNYSLSMTAQGIPTTTTGTVIPGIYSFSVANSFQLSTYDADHDTNSINCSTSYGNVAWWYGACWSGSFWGGGDSGGYQNAPFWTGSTTEYFAWGAIWLREPTIPITKSSESNIKVEGTNSLKLNTSIPQIDSNTVALWHLDETGGTGAYLKDSSSNVNHGTPTGTSLIDGISGKARSFNGSSDNIGLSASTNANVVGSISIEMWIKPTLATSGVLIHKDSQYSIQVDNSGSFFWADSSNWNYAGFGATNIGLVANKWQHLAVTKSGGIVNVYLDGVLKASKSFGGDITSTSNIMRIGCYAGVSTCTSSYFSGSIDEIRISNVARSSEEIAESYRMSRDHRITKTISSTNLSSSTKLPFYIASDRLGTFSQLTTGESAFANYEPDANTVGLWHLDDHSQELPSYYDYDNFEGGPGSSDDWLLRNSVDPDITSSTAYTGTYSLHMPTGWGQNFEGGAGEPTTVPYDANAYPYMCMAYKIPAGTVNNMLINVNGAWRSITMTQGEAPTSYPKAASWNPLTADNQWHYKCIDLNTQLTASLGAGAHNITAVIWHDGGGLATIAGEFWIDDFIISATPFHPSILPIKDSSGNNNHGQPIGTTFVQGKIGKARNFAVASADAVSFQPINVGTNYTIDSWIQFPIPNNANWRTIFANNGGTYHHAIVQAGANNLGVYNTTFYPCNWDPTSISGWHHLAEVVSSSVSYTQFYLDGFPICQSATQIVNQNFGIFGNYTSKAGIQGIGTAMDEVRFSNVARTPDEIRQAYEIGARTHDITIDFKAKLAVGNLITGSGDLGFTVDETAYGSSAMANHLFLGDKIIVKENYDGTEYIAQGTVNAVNFSTGATTVLSWDAGSTFPAGGFTVNATVFKWQREYFDLTGSLSTQRDAITRLTYRITDGSMGANVWLDDIKSSGGYLSNPLGSTITSATGNQYFQYRAIFSQNNSVAPSVSLNTVSLDYISNYNPTAPATPYAEGVTNPTGILDTTPEFSAVHNDADSDSANYYEIEVNTSSDFTGTVMWDSGQQSMTTTASGVRSPNISYAGATLTLNGTTYYWRIRFWDTAGLVSPWSATQNFSMNQKPNIPSLDSPSDDATNQSLTPILQTTASDNNDDDLRYKIELCIDETMTTGCKTFDQTSVATGWSTTPYASEAQATYTIQAVDALDEDTTYYWRSYAIDPAGTNVWSDTQTTPYSFTTIIVLAFSPASNCAAQLSADRTQMLLTWTDNADNENYYEVQRSVDGAAWAVLQSSLAANTANLADSSIASGHTYRYRIAPYITSGPTYASWCETNTLSLGTGRFSIQGVGLNGLRFQ